ncbi:MAG: S8 family peptidase [Caldilineaceae bacterium]|nr:S8 family peptidase [Caldilineaceae bacterium]
MTNRFRMWLPKVLAIYLALISISAANVQDAAMPHVASSVEHLVVAAGVPNDPDVFDEIKVYAPQLLNLFTAWDFDFLTEDIIIAVIDTGISHDHPEFAGRILPGYDFVNGDDGPEDDHGHGTHVAGIVAAAVNNNEGVVGVCGFCKILPVKVLTDQKEGSAQGIAEGLRYAADHGAQVAVLSLGKNIGSRLVIDAIEYARERNVFIVAAAGNENSAVPFYPAAYPGVFAVSATTRTDQRYSHSNYGSYIDVAAPGDDIFSTYPDLNNQFGGYLSMSGTSMAAPFVAGLAGLLLAQNPERTPDDLAHLITSTAIDLGLPGRDPIYGYGRIDPVAALLAEAETPPATALFSGNIWYDHDLNNQRDVSEELGLPWVHVVIYDDEDRPVGLTNSRITGEWRWVAAAPARYWIHARLPLTMLAGGESILPVEVTPASHLDGINFGVAFLPSDTDIQAFAAYHSGNEIVLSWTVTPIVRSIEIQRGTQVDGEFHAVGLAPIDNPNAASLRINFADVLPADLHDVVLYYRLQLSPGNVVVGPFAVPPHSIPDDNPDDDPGDDFGNDAGDGSGDDEFTASPSKLFLPLVRKS